MLGFVRGPEPQLQYLYRGERERERVHTRYTLEEIRKHTSTKYPWSHQVNHAWAARERYSTSTATLLTQIAPKTTYLVASEKDERSHYYYKSSKWYHTNKIILITGMLQLLLWVNSYGMMETIPKEKRINYNQNSRIKTMRVWLLGTILRKICEREGHELIPVNLT